MEHTRHNKRRDGYLYIISNPAFPDLLKIGFSYWPERRRATLSTGAPYDYRIEYEVRVENTREAESNAHFYLRPKWVRGEWFRVSIKEAKAALDMAASPWAVDEVVRLAKERAPAT